MKPIRTLAALLIGAIALSTPSYAGDKPMVNTDLKDLVFSEVKIEIADGAPDGISLEKAITAELLSRGATQNEKGLSITGKAMFMKAWSGNTVIRISTELSAKGLSFSDSAEYTRNEIFPSAFGVRDMKTQDLVNRMKQMVGNTFATQLNARRAANDTKPRTGAGAANAKPQQ